MKYMLFNPLYGPPWEYPAIKNKDLIISLKQVVYASNKYILVRNNGEFSKDHQSLISIVENPNRNDMYVVTFIHTPFALYQELNINMKVIRQGEIKIELIGTERNHDMSYSDYGMTLILKEKIIDMLVFHNFEKEDDYEFLRG
jgi:hypothetical protein